MFFSKALSHALGGACRKGKEGRSRCRIASVMWGWAQGGGGAGWPESASTQKGAAETKEK